MVPAVCGVCVYASRGRVVWWGRGGWGGGCHSCRPTVDPVPGNRISQVRAGGRAKGRDPGGGLRNRLHKEVHLQKQRPHWGTGVRLGK